MRYARTVNIKKNVTYTIPCECGAKITVEKIEDARDKGWRIDSNTIPMNEKSVTAVFCPECLKKENERLFNSEDLRERIRGKYYDKYPEKFKADALEYVGLSGHEKADSIFAKAWEKGHWAGNNEVLCELESLSDIFN